MPSRTKTCVFLIESILAVSGHSLIMWQRNHSQMSSVVAKVFEVFTFCCSLSEQQCQVRISHLSKRSIELYCTCTVRSTLLLLHRFPYTSFYQSENVFITGTSRWKHAGVVWVHYKDTIKASTLGISFITKWAVGYRRKQWLFLFMSLPATLQDV